MGCHLFRYSPEPELAFLAQGGQFTAHMPLVAHGHLQNGPRSSADPPTGDLGKASMPNHTDRLGVKAS